MEREAKATALSVGIVWLETALNFQDRLEVLALGDDGALWHAWQIDVPPHWSEWQSLGSPPARIPQVDRLTIGTNQDGPAGSLSRGPGRR